MGDFKWALKIGLIVIFAALAYLIGIRVVALLGLV